MVRNRGFGGVSERVMGAERESVRGGESMRERGGLIAHAVHVPTARQRATIVYIGGRARKTCVM